MQQWVRPPPPFSLSDSRRSPPLPPNCPSPSPPSSTSQDSAMSTMESTLSGKARYSANEAIKWEPTASSSLQSEATGRQIRSRVGHWLGSHGNKDGYGGGTGRTICVIICTRYLPAWPTLHGGGWIRGQEGGTGRCLASFTHKLNYLSNRNRCLAIIWPG